jgi:thymidylate synthase ThyX
MQLNTFKGASCEVAVVEHSLNQHTGKELITFQLRYWRAIHSELMTHRVFSRNASSSRAIPVARLLDQVRNAPAGPIHWGRNQPGMQAHEQLTGSDLEHARAEWLEAARAAAHSAERMMDLGVHKQVTNRLLEPFSWISVVVTATEWSNWYELRDHEDAMPEIQDLAKTMRLAISNSSPRVVRETKSSDPRGWHLPYVLLDERRSHKVSELLAMSSSRCARASYLNHDKQNPKFQEDLGLYVRLVGAKPIHASPLEHQAAAIQHDLAFANFKGGWMQHRTMLETAGSVEALRKDIDEQEN